eukprot:m.225181 g.225181  ORF g.225181 m.225181 type:complete len:354 (-) comp16635_c0_seq1:8-1069(-)
MFDRRTSICKHKEQTQARSHPPPRSGKGRGLGLDNTHKVAHAHNALGPHLHRVLPKECIVLNAAVGPDSLEWLEAVVAGAEKRIDGGHGASRASLDEIKLAVANGNAAPRVLGIRPRTAHHNVRAKVSGSHGVVEASVEFVNGLLREDQKGVAIGQGGIDAQGRVRHIVLGIDCTAVHVAGQDRSDASGAPQIACEPVAALGGEHRDNDGIIPNLDLERLAGVRGGRNLNLLHARRRDPQPSLGVQAWLNKCHAGILAHGDHIALLIDKNPAAVIEQAESVVRTLVHADAATRFDGINHQLLHSHHVARRRQVMLPDMLRTGDAKWEDRRPESSKMLHSPVCLLQTLPRNVMG